MYASARWCRPLKFDASDAVEEWVGRRPLRCRFVGGSSSAMLDVLLPCSVVPVCCDGF